MGKNKKNQEFINKVKNTIDNTIVNQGETEKRINQAYNEDKKAKMEAQNLRRETSIINMKKEIEDVLDKENNLK